MIYNRDPFGKSFPPLICPNSCVHDVPLLFRNAPNDTQHGSSSLFLKIFFFSHTTVAVIYLCWQAWRGLLWGSGRRSHYSGGSGDGWREESQTKHESEGVSQSACEHPGGLWESVSLEKCPRGGKLTDARKTSRAVVPGGVMGT